MNYKQKQQAMIKLAQVRLAINHVLRKRAMAKQANWPWWWSPENHTPAGVRTWGGYYRGEPNLYRPGSEAEQNYRQYVEDGANRFDRFFGQGQYANPNTGTLRAGDSANPRSVNRAANPNAK